jgi:NAD(P)-dependent dehydrogenase (short-subunit alcohol dehydrogenase family)
VTPALDTAPTSASCVSSSGAAGIASATRTLSRRGAFPLDAFTKVIMVNLSDRSTSSGWPRNAWQAVTSSTVNVASSQHGVDRRIRRPDRAGRLRRAKAGIVGLTLPVARDLAQAAIRVVTIAPGLFDTPPAGQLPNHARESLGRRVPHPNGWAGPDEFGALRGTCSREPDAERGDDPARRGVRMPPR